MLSCAACSNSAVYFYSGFCIYPHQNAGTYPAFFQAGLKRLPHAHTAPLSDGLLSKVRQYDTIVYCLSDEQSLEQLQKLFKAYPQKKYIIFSVLSPVLLPRIPDIPTVLALYSYAPVSFTAGFAALLGDFVPQGRLPLSGIR